jgi:hypothetical protein
LYLISGLGGGVLAVLFSTADVPSAGASGAVCGLLASMLVWVYFNRPYLPRDLASTWTRQILINIMLIALISMIPGVSWAGHLGGGVAGMIVAVPLAYLRFGQGVARWAGLAGVLAVPVLGFGLLNVVLGEELARHRQQRAPAKERPKDNAEVNKTFRSAIASAEKKAKETYDKDGEWLKDRTERRESQRAKNAVRDFVQRNIELEQLAQLLAKEEAFNDPPPAEAIKKAQQYIAAWASLYEMLVQCVQRNEWTKEDDAALEAQKRRVDRLKEEWDALLR